MKSIDTSSIRKMADSAGIIGSALCALHCIVIPIMLVLGTTVPVSLLDDEPFHNAMLWIILPSALFAFTIGCWRHKDKVVIVSAIIGLFGITLAAWVLHDMIGETGERVVTLISAVLLITAHYRNYKLCRTNSCEHEQD